MGAKMAKIFDIVSDKKGLAGRMKLAEVTGVSKAAASQMDDKPDILNKIKEEASLILGENIDKYL